MTNPYFKCFFLRMFISNIKLATDIPYLLEYKSHSCISRTPTLELKIGTKLVQNCFEAFLHSK